MLATIQSRTFCLLSCCQKTIILPVVLYGCETWSLTLRENHTLRVSENRALRRIYGAKRDVDVGGWRKLHEDETDRTCSTKGGEEECM
jgi:hypothetical protein